MLRSSALNVGRSLDLSLTWPSSGHKQKALWGCHVYKDILKPTIGEKLHAEQEPDNAVDEFAVKVVKNDKTLGHLPRDYSQILWYFITCGGNIRMEVTGCRRLVVRVEQKLIALCIHG